MSRPEPAGPLVSQPTARDVARPDGGTARVTREPTTLRIDADGETWWFGLEGPEEDELALVDATAGRTPAWVRELCIELGARSVEITPDTAQGQDSTNHSRV